MPPFGNFVALDRNEHDRGFEVGEGLGVDSRGRAVLRTDPSAPFYVNARGELALRLGEGLTAEPGSPVRLGVVGAKATRLAVQALQVDAEAADADITALSATVATHTSDIATLTADKAPAADLTAVEADVADHETRIAALEASMAVNAWTYVTLGSDFDTDSATAVDVTGLSFTPLANKTYEIEAILFCRTTLAANGPRPGFSIPTGMTDNMWTLRIPTSTTAETMRNEGGTVANVAASSGLPVADTSYLARGSAHFRTGATPSGDFKVILLSESAGTSVSVETGSLIRYRVIA